MPVYKVSTLIPITNTQAPHTCTQQIYQKDKMKKKNKKCHTTHMPPDLDLCPSDPKINRGHLLVMINLHVKYEDSVMNGI